MILSAVIKNNSDSELAPRGVLIHAKWGAEAEDATIKRYEQLRDAINRNSKSLTV